MNDTPSWASTDLRWRPTSSANTTNKSTASRLQKLKQSIRFAEAPSPQTADNTIFRDDPRGFMEDYGNDDTTTSTNRGIFLFPGRGRASRLWWCCWRLRNCTLNVTLIAILAISSSVVSIQYITSSSSSSTTSSTNNTFFNSISDTFRNWIVSVASTLTIFMAFLLLWQQRTVKKLGNFRQQHNHVRRQAYYLRQERERLHRTLDRLDETAADLRHVPQELHRLAKDSQLQRMQSLVKQQQVIQEQIRIKLHQQVIQQILSIVVQEDRDQNWTLRPTEVEKLIIRLGLLEHVECNEKLFRTALTNDPTVSGVMKIIRSLLEREDEYQHGTPLIRINIDSASTLPAKTTTTTAETTTEETTIFGNQ